MSTIADKVPPKLLKSRIRHSRLVVLLLIPFILFGHGMLGTDGFWHEILEWIGYFFIGMCIAGRAYCSLYIGGRKNDDIIQDGPYGIVRNPLYVFSFLGLLGVGLQSGVLTLALLLAVIFILYYRQVIAREEAFLLDKFGEKYAAYMRDVPRWIPDFSHWSEPAELVAKPNFVRHTMTDALWFLLPLPCFELLEKLHDAKMLTIYFVLP